MAESKNNKIYIPNKEILPADNVLNKCEVETKDKKKITKDYIVTSYYDNIEPKYIDKSYNLTGDKKIFYRCKCFIKDFKSASCISIDNDLKTKNGNFDGNIGFIYDIDKIKCLIYGKTDIDIRSDFLFDEDGNIYDHKFNKNKSIIKSKNMHKQLKAIKNTDPNLSVDVPVKHIIANTYNLLQNIENFKKNNNQKTLIDLLDKRKKYYELYKIKDLLLKKLNNNFIEIINSETDEKELRYLITFDIADITKIIYNITKNKTLSDDIYKKIENYVVDNKEDIKTYNDIGKLYKNITNIEKTIFGKTIDEFCKEHSDYDQDQEENILTCLWHEACNSNKDKIKQKDKYKFRTCKREEFLIDSDKHILVFNDLIDLNLDTMELSEPIAWNELILISDIEDQKKEHYVFPIKSLIINKEINQYNDSNIAEFILGPIWKREQTVIDIVNFQMQKGLPFIYIKEQINNSTYEIKGMLLSKFYEECIQNKSNEQENNIKLLQKYEKKQIALIKKHNLLKDDKIFIELVEKLKEENKNKDEEKKDEVKEEERLKKEEERKQEQERISKVSNFINLISRSGEIQDNQNNIIRQIQNTTFTDLNNELQQETIGFCESIFCCCSSEYGRKTRKNGIIDYIKQQARINNNSNSYTISLEDAREIARRLNMAT